MVSGFFDPLCLFNKNNIFVFLRGSRAAASIRGEVMLNGKMRTFLDGWASDLADWALDLADWDLDLDGRASLRDGMTE